MMNSPFGTAEPWSAGAMLPLSSRKPCFRDVWKPLYTEHGSAIESGSMAAALQIACGAHNPHLGTLWP